MSNENKPQEAPCPPSFEEALARLEAIVELLEEGEIGLADALARYEEGVALLKQCYGLLEHAERRIELLSGVDAQGNPITAPFDDSASLDADPNGPSATRRRAGTAARPKPRPEPPAPQADIDAERGLF
ncbi:MAG: exodeoxyribonuclease VII small subunit [Pirellulales bacterium]